MLGDGLPTPGFNLPHGVTDADIDAAFGAGYATEACEACCERVGHTRVPCEDLCDEARAELAEDEEENV